MLLNVSAKVWIIILTSSIIAILYALIEDKKENKRENAAFSLSAKKYLAIVLCILIAIAATVISKMQAYVGAPMLGLIMGILIVNFVPDEKMGFDFKKGTVFAGKKYLSLGIICLGATLAFNDLFSAVYALPLVLFNMAFVSVNQFRDGA